MKMKIKLDSKVENMRTFFYPLYLALRTFDQLNNVHITYWLFANRDPCNQTLYSETNEPELYCVTVGFYITQIHKAFTYKKFNLK